MSVLQRSLGPGGPVYYVDTYGAKGDGTTDDSAAIQAALNAAFTAGGGQVVFTPGKSYRLLTTLQFKTNTTVVAYGAYIFNGNTPDGLHMIRTYDTGVTAAGFTSGWSNVTILGGIWDAKAQSMTAASDFNYSILTMSNSRNMVVRDAVFRNVPSLHGIHAHAIDGLIISGCRFAGFVDRSAGGTRAYSEACQLDLSSANVACKNVTFSENYVGPAIDGSGLGSFGGMFGSRNDFLGQFYTNIKVLDNTAEACINDAITMSSWKNSTVSSNTILESTRDGLRAEPQVNQNSDNISITGNTFSECGGRSIHYLGTASRQFQGGRVSDNVISTSVGSSHAIELNPARRSSIQGNTINKSMMDGICLLTTPQEMLVTGNRIQDVAGNGISMSSPWRSSITDNFIYIAGQSGIKTTGSGTDVRISDNHIVGAGRTTTNTYHGIHQESNTTGFLIARNRIRKFGSGNEILRAIRVDSSTSGTVTQNDIDPTLSIHSSLGSTPVTPMGSPVGAHTDASETTTSTASFGNLSGGATGPEVTLVCGESAIVTVTAGMQASATGLRLFMGFDTSGPGATVGATENQSLIFRPPSAGVTAMQQASATFHVSGLTPGLHTFTAKYKLSAAGTATFLNRTIVVQPLGV